jgi:hypothetical protein
MSDVMYIHNLVKYNHLPFSIPIASKAISLIYLTYYNAVLSYSKLHIS